ncbi:hypothetical protein SmJEL517_g01912 [Synchytrium microbalum]|uniref:Uncharacterized protein n=1 Tax=Synchytrium microbalum TaxID=1806994 RepID=A0A507C480_9FUNG|nr:uncharacterized protein SmJEL517_g01912 [Synchytrium microbalum]TPX35777.1 hypothetical protein SmJEL517_g01912 [Synchytrium microbalum]
MLPASILQDIHQLSRPAKASKKKHIPSASAVSPAPQPTPSLLKSPRPISPVELVEQRRPRVNFASKPTILRSDDGIIPESIASPRSSATSASLPIIPSHRISGGEDSDVLPASLIDETRDDALRDLHTGTSYSTRKEVASLRSTMLLLLRQVGGDVSSSTSYPTELAPLLHTIEEEQKIYDAVFKEVVRQVAVHMLERGELLSEIRSRYAAMFRRIPQQVVLVHTELQASRRLNARLGEELKRSRQVTETVLSELEAVKKFDAAQSRPSPFGSASRPATPSNPSKVVKSEEDAKALLEKFHELYKMQRGRLEVTLKECEHEKTKWSTIATALALRLGDKLGMPKLKTLHLSGISRYQRAGQIIMSISTYVSKDVSILQHLIGEWKTALQTLSDQIVTEDRECVATLVSVSHDMDGIHANLVGGLEATDLEGGASPAVKEFTQLDIKTLAPRIKLLVDRVGLVAGRFGGTGKDIELQEKVEKARQLSAGWTEAAIKSLRRCEKTTNGSEYGVMVDAINKIAREIQTWLARLEARITGDDGGASQAIALHNKMEDKYASIVLRDSTKPLSSGEQFHYADSLMLWKKLLSTLIVTLSKTAEADQKRVPILVESWLSNLQDKLRTDADCRIQENEKLASKTSHLVVKLVQGDDEKPNEDELNSTISELLLLNESLKRDSVGIEILSDEGESLHSVLTNTYTEWTALTRELLGLEQQE